MKTDTTFFSLFIALLLGHFSVSCQQQVEEVTSTSIQTYYEQLPDDIKRLHMQGLLQEPNVSLDTIIDEANHYFALVMDYHGDLYYPFELKAYHQEGEIEPYLVVNQHVWDVGDPFYETHMIRFDSSGNYQTVLADVTKMITGRAQFFPPEIWKEVEAILECQLEMEGFTIFPEVYFHVQRNTQKLEVGLDGIAEFVDWCGISEQEWQEILKAYTSLELSWNSAKGTFE